MRHIVIIGAGIVGATCAWVLAREGARVTVFDGGQEAASDGSLAWLNACSTADLGYAQTRAESVRLWRAMSDTPGCPITFSGSLMWGDGPEKILAQSELMTSVGWRSIVMPQEEIQAVASSVMAPDLALFSPDEGYADPQMITAWMKARAVAVGAAFESRVVTDINTIDADHVLVCAGNGALELLPGLPLRRSPGIVMRTEPMAACVPCVLATPQLDFWQGDDGVIVMSSSLSKTAEKADELISQNAVSTFEQIFPGTVPNVVSTIRRDRPIPIDGFPLVGRWGRVWVAVMHSGMTLAPVMAEALSDQILGRPERYDISRYRPDRAMGRKEEAAL